MNKKEIIWKYEIGQRIINYNENGNIKRDLTIIKKELRNDKNKCKRKWYKYICEKCNWNQGWIEEYALNKGNGCSCCAGKTVVQGINDIVTTSPWMVKYFQGGYEEAKLYTCHGGGNSNNKDGKIYPICPDCGQIKNNKVRINNIYNRHSIGCSCGDGISYPNKFMFKLLKQLDVNFISEYNPDWIRPKRYDFYMPSMNLIIEMDGGLGHGKTMHNKDTKTVEESKAIDDYKDDMARQHGIKVIRIDCEISELEFIKNNILNKLNKIFEFSEIDWLTCEKFAISNRVKEACNLWNSNPNITTTDIGKIMNVHQSTVIKYLKKGSKEFNWCSYNPNDEKRKNGIISGKSKGKQVEIFKDGISLGVFPSCAELSRQSEELFGVKLDKTNITLVCTNKRKSHKGYTFTYYCSKQSF